MPVRPDRRTQRRVDADVGEIREHAIAGRVVADLTEEAGRRAEPGGGGHDVRRAAAASPGDPRIGVGGEVHGAGELDDDVLDQITHRHQHGVTLGGRAQRPDIGHH